MRDEEEEDDGHEDHRQVVLEAAPIRIAHRPCRFSISVGHSRKLPEICRLSLRNSQELFQVGIQNNRLFMSSNPTAPHVVLVRDRTESVGSLLFT